MKDLPEIAPELRGLLEEIVADPRSAIRFAPRHALRSWFDSGETIRAGDAAGTLAERHLLEAYKEELAELLCEASRIAYWKAPQLVHRTIGSDGCFLDPLSEEPLWRSKAERVSQHPSTGHGVDLLSECLGGLKAGKGFELAQASLQLVPNDRARYFVALNAPWGVPHVALAILDRVEGRVPATLRLHVLRHKAARLSSVGENRAAREAYRTAFLLDRLPVIDLCYAINLSCILGDERSSREHGQMLAGLIGRNDPNVAEARSVIGQWIDGKSAGARDTARKIAACVSEDLPESVTTLFGAFEA